jgi:2,3-bisphosphoglycerate-independent phosphoglycerate mutase
MTAPGVLIVLDGWGYLPQTKEYNAIRLAPTPVLDDLMARYPYAVLQASGKYVGLPPGAVGNSEIGHLTIGAGRTIEYESTRVERAAATGELLQHPVLRAVLERVRSTDRALHLLGLCSDGMVHAHIGHFAVLIEAARAAGVTRVFLHASTDGRDVPDGTADRYLGDLERIGQQSGVAQIATVIGRAYTMDRTTSWHLTQAAYELVRHGQGRPIHDPREAAATAQAEGLPDEKVHPSVVVDQSGQPIGLVQDGDALVFVNFRGDRMRQIVKPFAAETFDEFERGPRPQIDVLSLTEYFATPPVPALFGQADASGGLADLLDHQGVRNLRVAESEKFPHVTFFINGRDERKREFEEHVHVPSPKGVDFRTVPELSAATVTEKMIAAIERPDVGLVIANLANADVVAHTGDLQAVEQAVQTIDRCLGLIVEAAWRAGRWVALVGDHGNAEVMWDPQTNKPHVGHTTNPVPFIVAHPRLDLTLGPDGTLADVAPTIVELLQLPKPSGMNGANLLRPFTIAPGAPPSS